MAWEPSRFDYVLHGHGALFRGPMQDVILAEISD